MSKVTAGRLDERSRLSEWGPYSDWEEGLTHPEGGVQRTPSSALGLLWTWGAINALKTEEHPASGLEACLPMSGMLGMGVHSTALSTVSQRTPPTPPHASGGGGEPRHQGEHGPSPAPRPASPLPLLCHAQEPQVWCSSSLVPRGIPWCRFTPSPRPFPSTSRLPMDD